MRALAGADHRRAHDLVLGVLRHLFLIDAILRRFLKRPVRAVAPRPLTALRVGVYDLLYNDHVPPSAVVSECVGLAGSSRSLRGLVNAVLRRGARASEPMARYRFGEIALDFLNYQATKAGKPLSLTPREFKILKLFVENRGRVISRNELLDKIWGYTIFPTTRTVDNHIVRIRKQIEPSPSKPEYIISVRGVGTNRLCVPTRIFLCRQLPLSFLPRQLRRSLLR